MEGVTRRAEFWITRKDEGIGGLKYLDVDGKLNGKEQNMYIQNINELQIQASYSANVDQREMRVHKLAPSLPRQTLWHSLEFSIDIISSTSFSSPHVSIFYYAHRISISTQSYIRVSVTTRRSSCNPNIPWQRNNDNAATRQENPLLI